MTDSPDTTAEARPADPRRQCRIANANAQRVDFYRGRGFPADSVRCPPARRRRVRVQQFASAHNSNARIVGVPIETVAGQIEN